MSRQVQLRSLLPQTAGCLACTQHASCSGSLQPLRTAAPARFPAIWGILANQAAQFASGADTVSAVFSYIADPLLVNGRKFHIRAYALCVGSLAAYVHSSPLALFAAAAYPQVCPSCEAQPPLPPCLSAWRRLLVCLAARHNLRPAICL